MIHAEANACGSLSIGTKHSGNEDAIGEGNGFLVEFGNVDELSNKIKEVLSYKEYPKIDQTKIVDWKDVSEKYYKVFECAMKIR